MNNREQIEKQLSIYKLKTTDVIEVCSKCLQASCWASEFMCDENRHAGTTKKTVAELLELGVDLEHPSYWAMTKVNKNGKS